MHAVPIDHDRRAVLSTIAGAAALPVAGCLSAGTDDGSGELGDPADGAAVDVLGLPNPSFEPGLVHVRPGTTVEWTVRSDVTHTVTAYHPDRHEPRRIPDGAQPWDSGRLHGGETFEWTFEREGVYDYADTYTLCARHEAIGAVGRVVVGWPDPDEEVALQSDPAELPGRATTVARRYDEATRAVLDDR